jgi:FkbM family methyltransferase
MKNIHKTAKHLLKLFYKQIRLLYNIGLKNYLHYHSVKKGQKVMLHLSHHPIWVRKGSPDVEVAASCLIKGEFNAVSKFLDQSFDGIIIDAGGYIGTSALAFSDLFPNATVITIEPSKNNIELLKLNVSHNSNIKIIYGALLGSEKDSVDLKNRGTGEWGFTVVDNPLDNNYAESLHQTPAFNLKKLGIELSNIGLLKLDIEGGEYDLFINDAESLKEIKVIAVELHDRIVSGCTQAFMNFSSNRTVFKDHGEKYFSIKI